jgi:hypothetical protein
MTTQQEQEPDVLPDAAAQAWNVISDDARAAIFERSEGAEWARRWWIAEASLIELRRLKGEETP